MFRKLQPAHDILEESVINRKSRLKRTKEVLEDIIAEKISERSALGYFFGTVSFLNEDGITDYEKRDVFDEEVAPTLIGLGYKIVYSDGYTSQYASIDWKDAAENTTKE